MRPALAFALLCALVAFVAGGARPASAQTIKLGFVDSQRIFEQYRAAQEAQERFTREIQAWRTDADERRRAVDVLRNELKDQSLVLSEAKRLEKETALQKAVSDYDKFVQDFWGPGGRVQRLNDETTREIIGKIRDAVELIANREGYDLVLDAADGNVIFGVKSLDLTDRVLEQLNQALPGAPTPP
ncbi:MAG: OmpH family outer membrane protein [Candidatus Eiseniibacteriota bacterium]